MHGVYVFRSVNQDHRDVITGFMYSAMEFHSFQSATMTVLMIFLGYLPLLALLFLFGMTAFGSPLILLCLIAFGFRGGVLESYVYLSRGFVESAAFVIFPMMLACVAMITAVKASLRMSFVFSKQLLPSGAHCGGLWMPFKRYLSCFMICLAILFGCAVTEVLIHILFSMM